MKKYKTDFVNVIGSVAYPIYLVVYDDRYDLECEYEIYAMAWYNIYVRSVKAYERGELLLVE